MNTEVVCILISSCVSICQAILHYLRILKDDSGAGCSLLPLYNSDSKIKSTLLMINRDQQLLCC